jgi:hypothetical protein
MFKLTSNKLTNAWRRGGGTEDLIIVENNTCPSSFKYI